MIGTRCVFDIAPRTITEEQQRALRHLADRVVDLLELELRTRVLSGTVEDLRHAQAELKRSNEALAAFAGQVSHDLRNPLSAVTMAVRIISDQLGPDHDARFLLDRALSGAHRMQVLIDDLLGFARIGGELARVEVDLDLLTSEVLDDLSVPLAGATVAVGRLPIVVGDPVQLRAVLQNLVANATKFTRPGEKAQIEVRAERRGDRWRVVVDDRGPGIAPEDRERVFRPLARVDKSVEGSGIGLATCRRIVEAHGGRIGLDDAPSGGTRAWFELPV